MSVSRRSPIGRFDPLVGVLLRDPYDIVDDLGNAPPFWVEDPNDIDGYWVATSYNDVKRIFQNSDAFSSVDASVPYRSFEEPLLPIFTDPPETTKLRFFLLPHFTLAKIRLLETKMRSVCSELLERISAQGRCDAVAEFASVYPVAIFAEFFGLPPRRIAEFRSHAHTFLHDEPKRAAAWGHIREIIKELLLAKRSDPKDDLMTAIVTAEINGVPIELSTAVNIASTVFLGGLDTLPSNIGWSLRYLAHHPEHRRTLVSDPQSIPGAVEEFLRYFTVANPRRRAVKDVDVSGSLMRANDRVILMAASADRDPCEFDDAHTVRFERERNRHFAFGGGAHRCLGSHLARHELGVALGEWHARIPDYRMMAGAEVTYHGGVLALSSLPLEWD